MTKMPVMRIEDLAKAMIELLAPYYGKAVEDIAISEIGTKPGEKLYEELMSPEETRRTIELKDYFSVLPAFRGIYHDIGYRYESAVNSVVTNPYISEDETPMSIEDIKCFLREHNLLSVPEDHSSQRYWPGDKEEKE